MTALTVIALIAFALFAIIDWMAVSNEQTSAEYVAKPAALAALTVFALTGPEPSGWLIIALLLSLLGDVYLMLPANLFTAGLAAFLLAHLAYIADFQATTGVRLIWWVVVMAASAPVGLRILRAEGGAGNRAAIAVYMAVIAMMVASAFASGSVLASIGAVLFLVSDCLLAWDRFVARLAWARPVIIMTYHLGQLGLVTVLRAAG